MKQPRLFGGPAVRPAVVRSGLTELAARLPGVRLGTSSWSFPGWQGLVWNDPCTPELLSAEGLSAYAAHPLLRTVSIDRTYYRLPKAGLLAAYAAQVPDDFRFIIKAPAAVASAELRGVANPLALDPSYVRQEVLPRFLELGDRLGKVLLQIPPQSSHAFGDRFYHRLAEVLSVQLPWCVEVRTSDWFTPDLAAVLRDTHTQPCLSIHPKMPPLREQWVVLNAADPPDLVVRWNLTPGHTYESAKERYAPFDRMLDPDLTTRGQVASAIRWALERERPVWVVANNKAEGCAPLTLEALARAVFA